MADNPERAFRPGIKVRLAGTRQAPPIALAVPAIGRIVGADHGDCAVCRDADIATERWHLAPFALRCPPDLHVFRDRPNLMAIAYINALQGRCAGAFDPFAFNPFISLFVGADDLKRAVRTGPCIGGMTGHLHPVMIGAEGGGFRLLIRFRFRARCRQCVEKYRVARGGAAEI